MSDRLTTRDVRLVDNSSPAQSTYVPGSVHVGMRGKAAYATGELALTWAVCFGDISALGTTTTGVARIDKHNGYSGLFRLIGNKRPELKESPGMQSGSLLASNRDPQTNTLEMFKCNRLLRALRFGNEPFRYYVIRVFGKTRLFTRESFEAASCRFRSLLLQLISQATMPMTNTFDRRPGIMFAGRISQHIRHTQIAADYILHIFLARLIDITGSRQIERAPKQHQVRLALLRFQKSSLPLTSLIGKFQATASGPDRDKLFTDIPAQDAQIVSNRAIQPIGTLAPLVQLVRIRHLGDTPHNGLGSEFRKAFPRRRIEHLVDLELSKYLRIPSLLAQPIAATIRFLHGVLQGGKRALVSRELDRRNQLQTTSLSRMEKSGIPPTNQSVGFLPKAL
jgi:hypothetical protein